MTALLQLRPNRADLLKLLEQLAKRESRHQDRLQSRTKSRVSALIKEFRYQDALSLLSKLEESGQIRSEKLGTWVKTTRERVNRTYKPLRSQWDEMEQEAKRAYEQGDFGRAVELITAIPGHERGSDSREIRVSAAKQSADRQQAATESNLNWKYRNILLTLRKRLADRIVAIGVFTTIWNVFWVVVCGGGFITFCVRIWSNSK